MGGIVGDLIYEELKSPVTAQLEVTYKCTSRCNYCYNSWRNKKDFPVKSLSKKDAFTIAKKLVDGEIFEVVLTGGEPLLRRDLVYPVAKYLSSNNVDVGLNTNLILLKNDDILKIRDSGISRIFASLPSANERLYNKITRTRGFRRVVDGIERLVNAGIPLGINMVVTKLNKDYIYETGKFLKERGVKYFSATPASPCDHMPRELELKDTEVLHTLDELLKIQKDFDMSVDVVEPLPRCITDEPEKYEQFFKRDCAAGKATIAISASGKVRPCTHIPKEYGDLINEDLSVIWRKLKPWREGRYIPSDCRICSEKILCSFGCREAGRIEHNDYAGMDPWASEPVFAIRGRSKLKKIPKGANLELIPNLRFRKEERGYFIFSPRDHSAIYANESLFRALALLRKKGKFNIAELEKWANQHEWINIVNYLNNRGFINIW